MEWKNKSEALATLGKKKKQVSSTLLIKVLRQSSNVGTVLLVYSFHKTAH